MEVIRISPDEAASIRLTSALAMETNPEWMETVYLKMDETTVRKEMVKVARAKWLGAAPFAT